MIVNETTWSTLWTISRRDVISIFSSKQPFNYQIPKIQILFVATNLKGVFLGGERRNFARRSLSLSRFLFLSFFLLIFLSFSLSSFLPIREEEGKKCLFFRIDAPDSRIATTMKPMKMMTTTTIYRVEEENFRFSSSYHFQPWYGTWKIDPGMRKIRW